MTLSDRQIDVRLRQAPSPRVELLEGLHGIPLDVEVETMLAAESSAEPSERFLDRLHATVTECEIEHQLAAAPGARAAVSRLHQIPAESWRRRRRISGWAIGASAAVIAVAVQLATIYGALEVARPTEPPPEKFLVVNIGPLQLTSPPEESPLLLGPTFEVAVQEEQQAWGPEVEAPWRSADSSPWTDLVALIDSGVDLSEDIVLAKWGVLGAPNDPEETTPELDELMVDEPRGVEPPRLRGVYDRAFLLREKESPPLSPAAHQRLAHSHPPLSTRTDSFDQVRRAMKRDRLPDEHELRVEDFVAAQRYDFSASPGSISLRAFAGPSKFSNNGAGMLQVAVAVGRLPVDPPPTHWTIAVDVSSGMAWRHRLFEVRRALAALLREMRPTDRLSLVAFREDAWAAAELVTVDQAEEVLNVVESWEPRGRCDFAAGVRQGLSAALNGGFDGANRLVILSDGRNAWPENVTEQIIGLRRQALSMGVQWHWIELARPDDASPALVERLKSDGAEAVQVDRAGEAASAMIESWYGRSLLAATDARLHIQFEPKSVRFHRLVGHQANAFAGLKPVELQIDLRRGDQANVLYEIWLTPNGPSQVARATLEWHDPRNGARRTRQLRITRADFALSFEDAAAPLQHASLAAEAGEVLARSHFATNQSRTLRDVIAASKDVKNELQQQGEYRRFVRWLEEVERIRQRRGD